MLRWKKRLHLMTYRMTDLITISISIIISNRLYKNVWDHQWQLNPLEFIGMASLTIIFVLLLSNLARIYELTLLRKGRLNPKILARMLGVYVVGGAFIAYSVFALQINMTMMYIFFLFVIMYTLTILNRILLQITLYKSSYKSEAVKNILVIGQSEKGQAYIEAMQDHDYLNINILGYVSIKTPENYDGLVHIGCIEALPDLTRMFVIDEIAVARPMTYDERIEPAIRQCQERGITVTMLLDTQNEDNTKAQVAMVGHLPVLKFYTASLNETQILLKRVLDVIGAMFGMMFFGLAFIIIGPLIKLETPGPVIFKQERVGKNGRVFKVWKFRSMGVNAEAQKAALMASNEMSGHMFKMTDDPRITRVGAFIRKTSIDELPQFYNVLVGDMSLVGTRPPTVNEVANYEKHHLRRICITPGITGNWQVSGRSDIEDFEEVVRLDSEYIENWSLLSDIKILLKTVYVVFVGRGSK